MDNCELPLRRRTSDSTLSTTPNVMLQSHTPAATPRTLFSSVNHPRGMGDFNLNLQTAEEHFPTDEAEGDVVLGVLDGTEADDEWIESIARGNVLFLAIDGDLNKLASGFARHVKEMGGQLMHFRKFLVVTPPGVDIDTEKL